MKGVGRLLVLAGAAGVVLSTFLPWVTLEGRVPALDLDWIGARASVGEKTVAGTETAAAPFVLGVGAFAAVLALVNVARKLVMLVGLLVTVAGAALLYYVMNVVEIETSGNVVKETLGQAVLASSPGAGPIVLLASGTAILAGALIR